MSLSEYAQIQRAGGARVIEQDGIYWRRVRPFFYRPLLISQPLDSSVVRRPGGWPSGFQHIVIDPAEANSTMNFLVYDHLGEYSLEQLGHQRRRLIRNAAKHFEIRPLTSLSELIEQGYRAYLSFYQRTRYGYLTERRKPAQFARWAGQILKDPKTIVLGAYGVEGLMAVSVSYWVVDTFVYATLFAGTDCLKQGVCELMLHEVRRLAATQPGIEQILARVYQGGNSKDQYYLLRGAKLVRRPARFVLSAPALQALRWLAPRAFDQLRGAD